MLSLVGAIYAAPGTSLPAAGGAQHCVEATNNHNTEYTVDIYIGTPPQRIRVVADSGSADLLIDSTDCMDCAGQHLAFDKKKSTTFVQGNGLMPLAYGQGIVMCETASDMIRIGGAVAKNSSVLLMAMNGLAGFSEAPYDGVMGLGPQQQDGDGSGTSMLTMMGENDFSICFGQGDKTQGQLIIGGAIPTGAREVVMPAVGHDYWSLYLTGTTIGGVPMPPGDCSPHCVAVVDSGTSLIGVPTTLLEHINNRVGMVLPDCSNVHNLPDVVVTLGGEEFTLPPSIYVVKVDNSTAAYQATASSLSSSPFGVDNILGHRRPADQPAGAGGRMPPAGNRPAAAGGAAPGAAAGAAPLLGPNEICVSSFFQMDQPSDDGPMVIFGIPFLRAYAARFSRGHGDGSRLIGLAAIPPGSKLCEACAHADGAGADGAGAAAGAAGAAPAKGTPPQGAMVPPAADAPAAPPTDLVSIKLEHVRFPWWTVASANSTRHDSHGRVRV